MGRLGTAAGGGSCGTTVAPGGGGVDPKPETETRTPLVVDLHTPLDLMLVVRVILQCRQCRV